jgi:CheY-like chemotaxis protein
VEAIEALKKEPFTVVLMDIQMPEMDGYTATSVIRNELQLQIPIIAMTAHAMMGEKEKCLQLGMNDYISKPLKETILYNIIAQYSYQGMNI